MSNNFLDNFDKIGYVKGMVKVRKTKQSEKYPSEVARAKELIGKVAGLLGYDDTWRFVLVAKRLTDKALATCACEPEYRMAEIAIDIPRILEDPGENALENAVIHEVLHIPLWKVHELIGKVSKMLPDGEIREEFTEMLRMAEEGTATFFEHAPMWKLLLEEYI